MKKIRPFLKWAGNKYRCIEKIINALPQAERLIEPFTGSGAVFINTDYPSYLLAETNTDLISLYCYLQKEGKAFIEFCEGFFTVANNSAAKYYYFREEFNRSHDKRYKAALFLYLNRHGYNGLCRYNQRGFYNVPFGRYKKPYFPQKEMHIFCEKSKRASFIHNDFRRTFAEALPGDLIYCDPPYVPLSKSANFSAYTQLKFLEQDQIDLVSLAIESTKKGVTVIISNHDTAFTRHHYREGDIVSFPVQRFISCHAGKRLAAQELIAIFR